MSEIKIVGNIFKVMFPENELGKSSEKHAISVDRENIGFVVKGGKVEKKNFVCNGCF